MPCASSNIKVLLSGILLAMPLFVKAQSILSQNQDGFASSEYMDGDLSSANLKDTTVVEREVSHEYSQWTIDPDLGSNRYVGLDTLAHLFQNVHLSEGLERSYSIIGVLGSPRISRLYFEREQMNDFVFDYPLSYNRKNPVDFRFTDTKTPQLAIDYYKSGNKESGEDRIKGYFAANFSKRVGIGFDLDYTLGKGRYSSQSTSAFIARFYSYYRGDVYKVQASFNTDEYKISENGGITDDRYITAIEEVQDLGRRNIIPEDVPVAMTKNWNNLKHKQGILNQTIDIMGNFQRVDSVMDTVVTINERRAVSTVAHTMQIGRLDRRRIVQTNPANYYVHTDFMSSTDHERFSDFYINNTLSLSLNEGFSKWAFASIGAYARHEYRSFKLPMVKDSVDYRKRYTENDVLIGAVLERQTGSNLNFRAHAMTYLLGQNFGDYTLEGNLSYKFKFLKQEAEIYAQAYSKAVHAPFFMSHFHSTNYWWDENFKKTFSNGLGGGIKIGKTGTDLSFNVENVNNYIYIDNTGYFDGNGFLHDYIARQYSDGIQIISAKLVQNFAFGVFHWDNSITYQLSSNQDVLPLPSLNIYSNIYFRFAYFKRIKFEIGGDVSYFTKYYGQEYVPGIGLFANQSKQVERVEVGNYPMINVYANCEIEHVRFYFMCYHLNNNMFEHLRNAFYVPHYPINPRFFELGFSWTFYD